MNLRIHSVTSGKDVKAYLCLKVPTVLTENGEIFPDSTYVTARFPIEALVPLWEIQKQERNEDEARTTPMK